jgi:sensor histidine kinase YesM
MFGHRLRYFFITGLALYTFLNTVLCDVYYHFNIHVEWYYSLLTIFLITLLTWEGNRLAEPVVRKYIDPGVDRGRFLFSFFGIGLLVTLGVVCLVVWLVGYLVHSYDWAAIKNPIKLNLIYGSLINLFFHLINAIHVFFTEYRNKWKEAEELRAAGEQAKIQLLKNQVNPHFVFNNLNVLSAMVIKENPDANRFIEEFSKVYRYLLKNQDKELVPLQAELEFVEPYLYLLKKRFAEGLNVSVDIPESYRRLQVVPASLQLLVENAIKHNVVSRARPLSISIYAKGNQTIVVSNNIQPRQTVEDSMRIGLENIHKRYSILAGKKVEVRKTEESFQVLLPLLEVNLTSYESAYR